MISIKQPPGGLPGITNHVSERSSMMHERGHTYYGTQCPTKCEKASAWAARRLITPQALLNAARYEHRIDAIATTLMVLPTDVTNYLADLDPDEWLIMQRLVGHELTSPE